MPKGTLGLDVFVDGGRALVSALGTFLVLHWLPPLTPWVGIPLCIAVFTALSAAVGLVRRRDLTVVRALVQRRA
jgi:hypothetical protein